MPIFTNPPTFAAGRFSKTEGNLYHRDNLLALKFPPFAHYITVGHVADYSTTSTSFVDVDATNLALSITTTGDGAGNPSDVLIGLCGTVYSSGASRIYFRILEDGATLNIDGDGLLVSEATGVRPVCFDFLRVNASIGTHIYKLQYKVSSGTGVLLSNAGTSGRDCKCLFYAREIS